MPQPMFKSGNGPLVMSKEEIKALSEKIERLVMEECPPVNGQICEGTGEALMLAAHHLLGWRGVRALTRS